jgi:cation diffusion facilitator CzcD-associated flavoprotein CzcO
MSQQDTSSSVSLPYAVIGAGPSGLAAAKNLRAEGIECEVLEAHQDVGGIWDRSNPRSSVYAATHTITSKAVTAYEGFPLADHLPTYPRHDQILRYLREFAAEHDLRSLIRFGQDVVEVAPEGPVWRVRTADGTSRHYRGVVVANGHNWSPNVPRYEGSFAGPSFHSRDYDAPSVFEGKRVLVVGAGNSGCDIAVDAARHADQVLISMRRGYYFVPKFVFGRPADEIGQNTQALRLPIGLVRLGYRTLLRVAFGRPQDYGLPAPDHQLLESPPIVNSLLPYYVAHGRVACRPDVASLDGDKVHFVDGGVDAVDVIVYATGFRVDMPFLDGSHVGWTDGRPDLYLMAMSRQHDNLFVAGLTDGTGGHFPTVDLQTRVIARFIRGHEQGSPEARRLAAAKRSGVADVSGGIEFIDSPRSLTQFELHTYLRLLRRHLDRLS